MGSKKVKHTILSLTSNIRHIFEHSSDHLGDHSGNHC